MLTVNVICIGKLKEEYWRKACEEYAKRLSAFCLSLIHILFQFSGSICLTVDI